MAPIDGAIQILTPKVLRKCLLYHSHNSAMAGHPNPRQMYDSMQREFLCPHMADDVYKNVSICSTCAWNGTLPKFKLQLQFFPASSLLELVPIDNLGALPCTVSGNQYVIVMTDRYSKLARAMPSDKTSSPNVANLFFDSWVVPYGIPAYIQTDYGMKFTCALFGTIYTMHGGKT